MSDESQRIGFLCRGWAATDLEEYIVAPLTTEQADAAAAKAMSEQNEENEKEKKQESWGGKAFDIDGEENASQPDDSDDSKNLVYIPLCIFFHLFANILSSFQTISIFFISYVGEFEHSI